MLVVSYDNNYYVIKHHYSLSLLLASTPHLSLLLASTPPSLSLASIPSLSLSLACFNTLSLSLSCLLQYPLSLLTLSLAHSTCKAFIASSQFSFLPIITMTSRGSSDAPSLFSSLSTPLLIVVGEDPSLSLTPFCCYQSK